MKSQFKVILKLLFIFSLGSLLLIFPHGNTISNEGWHILVISLVTIVALIANFFPMSLTLLIALATMHLAGVTTIDETLNGFGTSIVWLVIMAFFISRGVINSKLGNRVAFFLMSRFGNSLIGLSYSLILTELLIAPVIPSATARSGGIISPIALDAPVEVGTID